MNADALGACRTEFADLTAAARTYPVRDGDSRLRRLVLNRHMLP